MTQKIEIGPIVKVIGNKEYIVESVFSTDAKVNLTDKIKLMIDKEIENETDPLQFTQRKLTLDNPTGKLKQAGG